MHLIPRPKNVINHEGEFFIERDTEIILSSELSFEDLNLAIMIQEEIEKVLDFKLNINKLFMDKEYSNSIILRECKFENEEEYKIEIKENKAIIEGSGAGLFYGCQSFRQLVREFGACIPNLTIEDSPYFKYRGFYHDVTRGMVPTLDTLKSLVDKAAFYKINQLQLYIEHTFAFKGMSEVWMDKDPLTAEEILILDKYCKERHVELVPSLSTFGHLYEALRSKSFRELCELEIGDEEYSFVDRMAHHTLDVTNSKSLDFVESMLLEFIPLFSSDKFNICCDETFDLGKGKSKEKAEKLGVGKIYTEFLNKVYNIVKSFNKNVMFWGDIIVGYPELLSDIPENLTCLTWNYHPQANDVATKIIAKYNKVQYVCPGVGGWNMMMNLIEGSFSNIRRMVNHGMKYGAIGVLNTNWGDYGNINLLANSMPSMIYGAGISWNPKEEEFNEIFKSISLMEFGDESMKVVSLMDKLSKNQVAGWGELVRWKEKFNEREETKEEIKSIDTLKVFEGYKVASEVRREFIKLLKNTEDKEAIQSFVVSSKGWELIDKFFMVLLEREFNKKSLLDIDKKDLAKDLELWFYDYTSIWRKYNKESELNRIREVIVYMCSYLRD
ncbi:family 20 glycosylhydrolase [Clostridium perfringens]|uniref:beta-N-acetylhexosaminidase n=1 Tax=Clostridium perfringens TaxID=1502 RepID=UPI001A29A1CD|nr:family 20 glycosylhydrolase [Clostridium perfringens]MDG6878050.1 Beta-hexosaminidase [Clostridium perfringens]MDG6887695.1 Beta-hexosaminidase [Clostridium perfringens]MDH5079113.1 Beta-hexosaminidase [Clostridium perfringens]MDK0721906.1 family 20 glycosylhydrolase [Clostridium perfringens]MDK0769387.1 family 20 glycosylhydrolase [Clostridium perfringens]